MRGFDMAGKIAASLALPAGKVLANPVSSRATRTTNGADCTRPRANACPDGGDCDELCQTFAE
jgi:hypothetical protein